MTESQKCILIFSYKNTQQLYFRYKIQVTHVEMTKCKVQNTMNVHFKYVFQLGLNVFQLLVFQLITFCVSRRRRKMYCGHARLSVCVCLSVCVSVRGRTPTLLHGPGCNLGRGRGCPLVVHYWADLQLVHRLRCYGNITRTLVYAGCPRVAD